MPELGEIKYGREIGKLSSPSNQFIWVKCLDCGNPKWAKLLHGKPESNRCMECSGKLRRGSLNGNWKGGRYISSHGYVKLLIPEHPHADSKGYVYEHRILMEKKEGRILSSDELVHHKNENGMDNTEGNLKLEDGIAWHKVDHRGRKDLRIPNEPNPLIECPCGCGNKFLKYDNHNRPRKYYKGGHAIRVKYVKIKEYKKEKFKEVISCACGCGILINKYDKYGRIRKFISGHNGRLQNK
jgi:ribosomal protein S27E